MDSRNKKQNSENSENEKSKPLDLGPMQFDKKRKMFFFGKSLDELTSLPPSEPNNEIKKSTQINNTRNG